MAMSQFFARTSSILPGMIVSGTLLTALLFTTACGNGKAAKAAAPQAMPVKVQTTKAEKVDDTTDYVSTLKSRDSAVVMPQVEGIITQIFVRSGDHVASGAPMMQIDPAKQQATVKSQEDARAAQVAQLTWAKQNYERVSGLASAGVVSKQDLDQARATLDAAQAQLHSLDAQVNEQQVQLHYYQVVAPRAGIVGDVPVRVGDRVVTTTTLTTVDRPGSLEAYIYIPIEKSGQLRMNLPVQIVDGSGNLLAASRVTFISPQVDTSTQTVLVKAQIANANESLRTAQFIRARVVWGSQERPVVPVVAVSRIGGLYFAFVAEADQKGGYVIHQKPLQIGQIVGNDYVVLDGVKPGDKVVVSGTQFLIDGVPVVPQESSS
ncbi:MAG TPA: efflux RND transporter periplasmic adaptor subunit [Terriglobales bacterium]|nr:efflux RND transporter periplasmic adaptor subunit [Terriglobales bacterium]